MVPPVDVIVYPEIDVFTVLVSAIALNVNAGAASVGVEFPDDGGGVYADVMIFSEIADAGDVPSTEVAVMVKVYEVRAERVLIVTDNSFQEVTR
jgi:hypothetical protein